MRPKVRGLIVLGLFAVLAAWTGAAWGEQAPPDLSVEAAKTDAAAETMPPKTAPGKTLPAKTAKTAASETEGTGPGFLTRAGNYFVAFLTYPLTVAVLIIIASY